VTAAVLAGFSPATGTVPGTSVEAGSVTTSRPMMGGLVTVHIGDGPHGPEPARAAERVLRRIDAWAALLTRFDEGSELSRLNAHPGGVVPIGPTLTAVLDWARTAETLSDGLVDAAMLDARLAAEAGRPVARPLAAARRWSLVRTARGSSVIREPGVRFDLDGVAKGWLADRALDITPGQTALVDADGDIAARVAPGDELVIGVADPREHAGPDAALAVVRLVAGASAGATAGPTAGPRGRRLGLATSGISVHRWSHGADVTHHLVDPATWRPASTDVVQATVLADSARVAEVFAKVAIIAGSQRAPALLDRPGVHGALLLTTRGEIRATPGMLRWLA
jgi:thiamine biosynthesis lipoprotein